MFSSPVANSMLENCESEPENILCYISNPAQRLCTKSVSDVGPTLNLKPALRHFARPPLPQFFKVWVVKSAKFGPLFPSQSPSMRSDFGNAWQHN